MHCPNSALAPENQSDPRPKWGEAFLRPDGSRMSWRELTADQRRESSQRAGELRRWEARNQWRYGVPIEESDEAVAWLAQFGVRAPYPSALRLLQQTISAKHRLLNDEPAIVCSVAPIVGDARPEALIALWIRAPKHNLAELAYAGRLNRGVVTIGDVKSARSVVLAASVLEALCASALLGMPAIACLEWRRASLLCDLPASVASVVIADRKQDRSAQMGAALARRLIEGRFGVSMEFPPGGFRCWRVAGARHG